MFWLFKGSYEADIDINVEVEVDVDIDRYFGCLKAPIKGT